MDSFHLTTFMFYVKLREKKENLKYRLFKEFTIRSLILSLP
jgi:hypothetical protein